MASAKHVLDEGLKLPAVERASVARELIASLDGPAEEDVDEAWLAEAERRQREAGDDPAAFEDWTDVRARIAERLRAARP
jgi:putative addiction module component (TIGR02574 family)